MEFLLSLFNNNIGVVLVVATLFAFTSMIIGKGTFFFKENNSIISARDINELRDKIDNLNILIKGNEELIGLSERVDKIKLEIKEIQSLRSVSLSDDVRNRIKIAISEVSEELLHEKIRNTEIINSNVKDMLEKTIKDQVLSTIESREIIKNLSADLENNINITAKEDYNYLLDKEYINSVRFKSILVNLFVFVNMSMLILVILLIYGIVNSRSENINFSFPTQLALTISGLYISFAAFVIYVIKFTNSRTLTILALREDWSKQNILFNLMDIIKSKENLNESDVAMIRSIMTNRTQREQKTNHPYEVFLQGISGSNIQFKGGKLQVGRDKDN